MYPLKYYNSTEYSLYKFHVSLKPQKCCGLSVLLEYLQVLDVKGRKKGVITFFLYFTSFIRVECFSKRPVIKFNAWDREENVVSLSESLLQLLCFSIPACQLVLNAAECFPLVPADPLPHFAQEEEGNSGEISFVSHNNET